MPNLLKQYNHKLKEEGWSADDVQLSAVAELQRLLDDLNVAKKPWPFSLFAREENVKGVYLYGGVGRGKSMIMDLFFDYAPARIKKRRIHFHEFMIETHDWLHANRGGEMADLLPNYASHVANNISLLCFDEFHVTDVADAMILGRLFTALIDQGVIVVATSNWAPDNLYESGLRRDAFLPFIKLMKARLSIVHLDSDTDYRQLSDPDQDVYYFSPLNKDTIHKLDVLFVEFTNGAPMGDTIIEVKGREMSVRSANDVARFTFADLCEQPLGAEDYIEVAKVFDTIFIENVPRLTYDLRNETKRLILLIDCLYEAKCRLIISAQEGIHDLYHGDDHAFEFDRTISRLMEMQSAVYHEERS